MSATDVMYTEMNAGSRMSATDVMYTEMNAGSRMSATDVMYTEMNAGCRMSATDVIQPVLPHDYAKLAVNTVRDAWGHCSLKECSRCRSRWLTYLVKFVSILLEFLAKIL